MKYISTTLLIVVFLTACSQSRVLSISDRENINRVAVVTNEDSISIGSSLASNPVLGAMKGFAGGILAGALLGAIGGPFGMAGGAALLAPVTSWYGAACGAAVWSASVGDPDAAFVKLYERSGGHKIFTDALDARMAALKPATGTYLAADALLEIRRVRISLGGEGGKCSPVLSGTVLWRLSKAADKEQFGEKLTSLKRDVTTHTFKDFFADNDTAGADVNSFVNALATAVVDDIFLRGK